ncbi:MAG: hypothetical protein RI897_601 [Verrucomicrobiota bacterium]
MQVGVGVVHAVFELAECSVVIMESDAATDLDSDVGSWDIVGERVCVRDRFLTEADGVHAWAEVHAPDGFGAEFSDVEPEVGSVEVTSPGGDEISQVGSVVFHVALLEHVVFALVPHEAFEAVRNALAVEIGERRSNEIEGERIELEA